ncbi:unnamed protein product [Lepidochelys olivacea]
MATGICTFFLKEEPWVQRAEVRKKGAVKSLGWAQGGSSDLQAITRMSLGQAFNHSRSQTPGGCAFGIPANLKIAVLFFSSADMEIHAWLKGWGGGGKSIGNFGSRFFANLNTVWQMLPYCTAEASTPS